MKKGIKTMLVDRNKHLEIGPGMIVAVTLVCLTAALIAMLWAGAQTEVSARCRVADLRELPEETVFLPHLDSDTGTVWAFGVVPNDVECEVHAKGMVGWLW